MRPLTVGLPCRQHHGMTGILRANQSHEQVHQQSEKLPVDDRIHIVTYIDSLNYKFLKSWSNTAVICVSKDLLGFCFKQESLESPSCRTIG